MLRNRCNQSVIHLPLYFNLLNGGQIYPGVLGHLFPVHHDNEASAGVRGRQAGWVGEHEKVLIWSRYARSMERHRKL